MHGAFLGFVGGLILIPVVMKNARASRAFLGGRDEAVLQDHSGADRVVARFVDDDEGAGFAVAGIGIGEDRLGQLDADFGDIVH